MPNSNRNPIITLTTDFGTSDYYVGAMKGVIHTICPSAVITDITHEIQPQNIIQGAFVSRQTINWYPPGTIHVVVVDPGVGSNDQLSPQNTTARLSSALTTD